MIPIIRLIRAQSTKWAKTRTIPPARRNQRKHRRRVILTKKIRIDSKDADLDSLGENDEDGGDLADAYYEKLWLEHKKDQPVLYK